MTDEKEWHADLTPKERRFIEEYLVDVHGTKAAIRSGYSKNGAAVAASRLLANPKIRKAVDALFDKHGISRVRIVEEMAKIAFASVDDYVKIVNGRVVVTNSNKLSAEQLAAVAEISETITEFGTAIKIRPYDKIAALTFLGKVARLGTERVEVSGPNGGPVQVEDPRARILERLASMAKVAQAEDAPNGDCDAKS